MPQYGIPVWRAAPFVRLLPAFIAGILTGYYLQPGHLYILLTTCLSAMLLLFWNRLSHGKKYELTWMNGIAYQLLIVCLGICMVQRQDTRLQPDWAGPLLSTCEAFEVVLEEPPAEKEKSFSCTGLVTAVAIHHEWIPARGVVHLYFKKDSIAAQLEYGSALILQKKPQRILNKGNPGGFDYQQYCSFRNSYHQMYLAAGEYRITGSKPVSRFQQKLFAARKQLLQVLRKWIKNKENCAVAEALLIGYRDDLDKKLVQAYSDTGVVHIIAISGLHLGMLYGLMLVLLKPFRSKKWIRWVKPLLLLAVLWGFSLLAGAAASILRSAVMFSFIVVGECLGRRTVVYNTLAASAFCLLLYNPYFLWDAGFLLSYTAVLGIVVFRNAIYHSIHTKNKLLDHIWQLNAITLSAQLLTLPVVLFYFHQFPNFFLFTNFFAVPLSGFILYATLVLLLVQAIAPLNTYAGDLVNLLIEQLNGLIVRTSRLPYAVLSGIQVTVVQTALLYLLIVCLSLWWLKKRPVACIAALAVATCMVAGCSLIQVQEERQRKLVVYQTPGLCSIDIIEGKKALFIGNDAHSVQQVLAAARTRWGVRDTGLGTQTLIRYPLIAGASKKIWILTPSFINPRYPKKIPVDLLLLTGNPGIRITELYHVFDCRQYVFDSSNPLWKIQNWKKEADSLHLRHHSVPELGAYVTDL